MCTSSQIIGSLLVLSVLEIGLGVSSVAVGAVSFSLALREQTPQLGDSSPFLLCGICGILCAKKKSGLVMILFSACCICGLIGGILNFQFLRAVTKKTSSVYPLHLASMSLACIGIGGCTLSSWLTCRLASYEQRRMFSEREHSLHHSHEMAEKRLRAIEITDLPSCPMVPLTPELPTRLLEESLPSPLQPLSSNTPIWACRLRSCEKIGDSYRGYCVSETELESILTFHKQQTQSVWGTRQSPSPAKPATRLVWESQYVPYDGVPFVNAGSRAVVMECQYGPRRNGFELQRLSEQGSRSCHLYRATCPARWYVQLPTQQAHQYHELETRGLSLSPSPFPVSSLEEEETVVRDENCALPSRLHPQVAHKIQELVSQGVGQVYAVRKQLRKFVERELFKPDEVPERHNLSFFPTVNDIKNHIHEVWKSLRMGDMVYNPEVIPATLQWTTDSGNILRETVTATFAEGNSLGEPVTSRVGASSTQTSLSPEPFHLLSPLPSFQPKISSHLQGLKLQPRLSSLDGSQALVSGNGHPSSGPSGLLDTAGNDVVNNHSLLLGQSQNLRTDTCLTQNSSAASAVGNLPESVQNLEMGPLVEAEDVEDTGNLEGSVNRILLGDVQTISLQLPGITPPNNGKSIHFYPVGL